MRKHWARDDLGRQIMAGVCRSNIIFPDPPKGWIETITIALLLHITSWLIPQKQKVPCHILITSTKAQEKWLLSKQELPSADALGHFQVSSYFCTPRTTHVAAVSAAGDGWHIARFIRDVAAGGAMHGESLNFFQVFYPLFNPCFSMLLFWSLSWYPSHPHRIDPLSVTPSSQNSGTNASWKSRYSRCLWNLSHALPACQ